MKLGRLLGKVLNQSANNVKTIHFNAVGSHFDRLHQIAGDLYDELSEDFDTAVEMYLESSETAIAENPNTYEAVIPFIENKKYNFEDGIRELGNIIHEVIEYIEEAFSETDDEGDKNFLADMKQRYNKHLYFFMTRRIIG
jgi:DNA-binding ferritin-like protein